MILLPGSQLGKSQITEIGKGLKGLLVVSSSSALCWDDPDADTEQMSPVLAEL